MKKRSGKVQLVFKPTRTTKEVNMVYSFVGIWQMAKVLYRAYKSVAYKVYIFFDENVKQ